MNLLEELTLDFDKLKERDETLGSLGDRAWDTYMNLLELINTAKKKEEDRVEIKELEPIRQDLLGLVDAVKKYELEGIDACRQKLLEIQKLVGGKPAITDGG